VVDFDKIDKEFEELHRALDISIEYSRVELNKLKGVKEE